MQTPSTRWTTHAHISSRRSCQCVISSWRCKSIDEQTSWRLFQAAVVLLFKPFNTKWVGIWNERCPCLPGICQVGDVYVRRFRTNLTVTFRHSHEKTKKLTPIEIFAGTDLRYGLHWYAGRFRFCVQTWSQNFFSFLFFCKNPALHRWIITACVDLATACSIVHTALTQTHSRNLVLLFFFRFLFSKNLTNTRNFLAMIKRISCRKKIFAINLRDYHGWLTF